MRTGLRPLKKFSQNFLKDETYARRLVDSMKVQPEDVILEIGAGEGMLTRCLMQTEAARIIAVELDSRMLPWLEMRFGSDARFRLIANDFLKVDLPALVESEASGKKIRVVGNLPYAITSPILFSLLENRQLVQDVTVTVQKEVAERFVSSPGKKAYGIPSVLFQLYGDLALLFYIPRQAFEPVPKVESAVLQCRFLNASRFPIADVDVLRQLVKTGFGQRRKMLRNTISSLLGSPDGSVPIDLTLRPEQVSIQSWAELANFCVQKTGEG